MPIIPLTRNSFVVLHSAITYPNRLLFHFVISSAVTGLSGRIQTSLCGEKLQVACNLYLWAFSSFVLEKRAGLLFKGSEVKKKKSASTIFALLAPGSEVTTQSLSVLVSSLNDATAGTKLVEMLDLIAQFSSQLSQSYL